MRKPVLGKGLESLIPQICDEEKEGHEGDLIIQIPVNDIFPNPLQPREIFNEEKLFELSESIKQNGILQPVIVRNENGKYRLVIGERRWRAAITAGVEKIPAIVSNHDDTKMVEIALVENIHRDDLNPMEEAQAYSYLINEHGYTQEKVSQRVSKSRSTIANLVRLLNIEKSIQDDIKSGLLSEGHARALLSLKSPRERVRVAELIKKRGLSVRQTEQIVKMLLAENITQKNTPKDNKNNDWLNIEEQLESFLSARVSIKATSREKGKIEISYNSYDELNGIIDRLLEAAGQLNEHELSVDLL